MKNKFLSVMLSGLILAYVPLQMCANAAEYDAVNNLSTENTVSVYAVGLIATYSLSCEGGSKTVYIFADVYGTEILGKVGFKNIKIQRSSDKNNWTTEKTISDLISKNTDAKIITKYAVSVAGGYYYRVVLEHYAKEKTWFLPKTQTVEDISNAVWVS